MIQIELKRDAGVLTRRNGRTARQSTYRKHQDSEAGCPGANSHYFNGCMSGFSQILILGLLRVILEFSGVI